MGKEVEDDAAERSGPYLQELLQSQRATCGGDFLDHAIAAREQAQQLLANAGR